MRDLLAQRLPLLLASAGGCALSALLLHLLGVGGAPTAFICLVLFVPVAVCCGVEAYTRSRYYRHLARVLGELDRKSLLPQLMEEPPFAEGRFWKEVLAACGKSMNDQIDRRAVEAREYQEYIETWVHEVKTPIASLLLSVEGGRQPDPAAVRREAERIDGYVEQALYYTRSGAPEKDYAIRPVSLRQLTADALKKNATLLIESGARVSSEGLDRTVYTDAKWVAFILGQLFQNAAKYRGEELLSLSLRGEAGAEGVSLSVGDRGVGIPPRDQGRVFEKGFTGENGRAFARSTGMGLYLCATLCKKLGMGIRLESRVGEGTCVTLTFPKGSYHLAGGEAAETR